MPGLWVRASPGAETFVFFLFQPGKPGNLEGCTWKPGSGWCGAKKRGACAAQKVESNHCASRRLQVWSLQPGPPSVIWTFNNQFLPIFNFKQVIIVSRSLERQLYSQRGWGHGVRRKSKRVNLSIGNVWKSCLMDKKQYVCNPACVLRRHSA